MICIAKEASEIGNDFPYDCLKIFAHAQTTGPYKSFPQHLQSLRLAGCRSSIYGLGAIELYQQYLAHNALSVDGAGLCRCSNVSKFDMC